MKRNNDDNFNVENKSNKQLKNFSKKKRFENDI